MQLMPADGQQIHVQAFHPDGQLAGRLHGVAVNERLWCGTAYRRDDLLEGKTGAGFVVDQHDADQHRILPAGGGDLRGGYAAVRARHQPFTGKTLPLQLTESRRNGGMLHRGGDRVPAAALPGECAAEDGQVVCLGTAGGENDGIRSGAEERSDLPARFLQFPLGGKADGVQLRAGILQPLQALFSDMAPEMLKIDPQIVADPMRNGSVSRIRRDNRYTRDKAMYRENMWISFLRDKKAWDNLPGFYLDISLRGSSYGVGFYHPSPRLMQTLRRMIDETPDDFVQAMSRAEAAGFVCEGDRYARPKKDGLPPLLDALYNRRFIDITRNEPDPAFFSRTDLPDILLAGFRELAPLYHLFAAAAEREMSTRGAEEFTPATK